MILYPCSHFNHRSLRATLVGYVHYPRDDMEQLGNDSTDIKIKRVIRTNFCVGYTMLTITAGVLPWSHLSLDDLWQKNGIFQNSQLLVRIRIHFAFHS